MSTEYQATVSLGDSTISAKSDNSEDIMRLLSLAGMAPQSHQEEMPPVQAGAPVVSAEIGSFGGSVENECSSEEFTGEVVEQADYDYSEQEVNGAGQEVNPSTFMYKGPKLQQRLVKGFAGDNALAEELHEKLINAYEEFLSESDDRENADGSFSPLSDPTKPEFDKDPMSGDTPVDDGSHSPMSTIERQSALK